MDFTPKMDSKSRSLVDKNYVGIVDRIQNIKKQK